MIVECSTHPQFVSNTYLVADGEGGPAFFVDAGGPVAPLIEAAERLGLDAHARAPHPPPLRPRLRGRGAARALADARGADQRAGAGVPGRFARVGWIERRRAMALGTVEAGQTLSASARSRCVPLRTPGHTAGMLSFLVGERGLRGRHRRRPGAGRSSPARAGRLHRRHAVQGLRRRREGAGAHDLHRPARLDHGHADGAAAGDGDLPGPRRRRRRSAREWDSNPFIRVWRGLDPEGSEPCTALGEPATLVLLGSDYDGGTKAWVRWPDGADDIVPGLAGRADGVA